MTIECIKEKLKEVIYLAERITGKNLALPILSAVHLEAKGQSLIVRATNLDIGIEFTVPAKIEKDGAIAVHAGTLSNFLGNLYREERVILKQVGDNINVSTSYSSTSIKTLPIDDFPTIPKIQDGDEFKIKAANLVNGLKSVAYAAALSDIKPEISSVYIYQDGSDLVFVSTDSFRLAEKRVDFDGTGQEFTSVIIPIKNVAEIIRIFDGRNEDVTLRATRNQISLATESLYFTSRLIDGVYPDYRQIMPSKFNLEALVERADLIQALKLNNIFADRFHQVSFVANPAENKLQISAHNQDVGENNVDVKISIKGDSKQSLEMSFNARYMLDGFQAISNDRINLQFTEKNRPLLVSAVGDNTFRYLVMPVNR